MKGLLGRVGGVGLLWKGALCWPGGRVKDRISFTEQVEGSWRFGPPGGLDEADISFDGKVSMNLDYAVDRLYEAGWMPAGDSAMERLGDGRWYPSMMAVVREFSAAGLQLSVKQNLMFRCYRATWAPKGEGLDVDHVADEKHGTVVGSCEREAAVFALAQLKEAQQVGIRQVVLV